LSKATKSLLEFSISKTFFILNHGNLSKIAKQDEFLYYMKFSFWHNMLYSTNSIVISVMRLFVHSKEYTTLWFCMCFSLWQ